MKNIINKILDNYLNDKLANAIKERIKMEYALDVRTEKTINFIFVEVKPFKYKEYTPIYDWKKENALIEFFNFDNIIKLIKRNITYLDKENRWD